MRAFLGTASHFCEEFIFQIEKYIDAGAGEGGAGGDDGALRGGAARGEITAQTLYFISYDPIM